jgi:hypothetical protein
MGMRDSQSAEQVMLGKPARPHQNSTHPTLAPSASTICHQAIHQYTTWTPELPAALPQQLPETQFNDREDILQTLSAS